MQPLICYSKVSISITFSSSPDCLPLNQRWGHGNLQVDPHTLSPLNLHNSMIASAVNFGSLDVLFLPTLASTNTLPLVWLRTTYKQDSHYEYHRVFSCSPKPPPWNFQWSNSTGQLKCQHSDTNMNPLTDLPLFSAPTPACPVQGERQDCG